MATDDIKLLRKMEKENKIEPNNIKLFDYQQKHADNLISVLNKNGTALDASDPGIGKTYIASYVCAKMNLRPIVICPKSVVNKWYQVLEDFNVNILMVTNYELITRGKYYHKKTKIICPYIKKLKDKKYVWNVGDDVIFIYDEVHKCKFYNTLNAKILLASKATNNKILLLSATIMEKPQEFAMYAYVLGFSDNIQVLSEWIRKLTTPAKTIHELLFDDASPKASRLSIAELGDKFPETQILAETYTMKKSDEIKKEYEKMQEKIKEMTNKGVTKGVMLAKLQKELQQIEILKIPTFMEMSNDYLDNNFSVVIFVNYTNTLNMLIDKFKEDKTKVVTINGQQNTKERDENIDLFQSDKVRVMVANIKAGGVGISLHDVNGKYPRISLISPTYSATNLIQVLGRIHRSGGKSKSLQRLIFAANTPEEKISKLLYKKLANLSLLNDGDLEGYYIEGLEKDEEYDKSLTLSNKDISLVIDEQLEKIKHKHMKRVNEISELFPNVINTISGTSVLYLLKGKQIFDKINILLLGELHNRYKECFICDRKCIEITNLLTYIMHNIRPNILDFYIEMPYTPSKKSTMHQLAISTEKQYDGISRIGEIFDTFKFLLVHHLPNTVNMRLHNVDVRMDILSDIETTPDHIALTFIYLFTDLMNYEYLDTRQASTDEITMFSSQLDDLLDMLKRREVLDAVKGLLTFTSKTLQQQLKISKQKEKFMEDYEKDNKNIVNEIIKKINKFISDKFSIGEKTFEYLLKVRDVLEETTHHDPRKRVRHFFRKMKHNNFNDRAEESNLWNIMLLTATYMDLYTFFRMLRKFDDKKQMNIVFYGGERHTKSILELFVNTGYFSLTARRSIDDLGNDCATIVNK